MLREFIYNLPKYTYADETTNNSTFDENYLSSAGYNKLKAERSQGTFGNGSVNVLFNRSYTNDSVNILLGLLMIFLVFSVVFCVLYLSHRNLKKRSSSSRRRWIESDANMEIYSVEQFFEETSPSSDVQPETPPLLSAQHGPPPAYEEVVTNDFDKPFIGMISITSLKRNVCQQTDKTITKKIEFLVKHKIPSSTTHLSIINKNIIKDNRQRNCDSNDATKINITNENQNFNENHIGDKENIAIVTLNDFEEQPSTSHTITSLNIKSRSISASVDAINNKNEKIECESLNQSLASDKSSSSHGDKRVITDESGLPTYDAAVKLEYAQNILEAM